MTVTKKTSYNKICVMCNEPYVCYRLSTIYCSKKCSNKARSMSPQLRLALIRRNSAYILATDKYIAHTMTGEQIEHHVIHRPSVSTHSIKGATPNNPAGEDLGLLVEYARQEALKRGVVSPEIKLEDMVLETEEDKKKPKIKFNQYSEATIDIDDTLPDPDDDGLNGPPLDIKPLDNKVEDNNNINPPSVNIVHKGIRKIGSK